jgi:hypothetical protein
MSFRVMLVVLASLVWGMVSGTTSFTDADAQVVRSVLERQNTLLAPLQEWARAYVMPLEPPSRNIDLLYCLAVMFCEGVKIVQLTYSVVLYGVPSQEAKRRSGSYFARRLSSLAYTSGV